MVSLFVHDGWTAKGRVSAVPGLYPSVSFTYRPATPRLRYELAQAEPDRRFEVACTLLCRQLVSVQADGETATIKLNEAQAATLHAGIFQAMFDAVMGYAAPDVTTEQAEGN